MTKTELQKRLIQELNSGKPFAYQNADLYTILLDLVQGNSVEEVFMILHNVATDEKQRETLEAQFEQAKTWNWEF